MLERDHRIRRMKRKKNEKTSNNQFQSKKVHNRMDSFIFSNYKVLRQLVLKDDEDKSFDHVR